MIVRSGLEGPQIVRRLSTTRHFGRNLQRTGRSRVVEEPAHASIRVGARTALTRTLEHVHGGAAGRLIGESVRTVVNATFRGVSARWLPAYLDETRTRWRVRALVADVLVERLLARAPPTTFDDVRRHFGV